MRPAILASRPTLVSVALLVTPVQAERSPESPGSPPPERAVEVEVPEASGEPARVRVRSGTFETRPENVDLLRKALAGEQGEGLLYAGSEGARERDGSGACSPRR